jgi:hypothetical protein
VIRITNAELKPAFAFRGRLVGIGHAAYYSKRRTQRTKNLSPACGFPLNNLLQIGALSWRHLGSLDTQRSNDLLANVQHLLRSTKTKKFFRPYGRWTSDARLAYDFRTTADAVYTCQIKGLRDMELVLRSQETGKSDITLPLWLTTSGHRNGQPVADSLHREIRCARRQREALRRVAMKSPEH